MNDDEMLMKIWQFLKVFQVDVINAIKDLKEENKKCWKENEKRWEENERRWEENRWLWTENREKWQQYDKNRKRDRADIIDILTRYEMSIAKSLEDNKSMQQLA